jgi:hypothetical protein
VARADDLAAEACGGGGVTLDQAFGWNDISTTGTT